MELDLKLKILYIYTAITTIPFGFSILFFSDLWYSLFGIAKQEQIIFGIVGSMWIAFGLLSAWGYHFPIKFIPILMMQFFYKVIWIIGVFLPLIFSGNVSMLSIVLLLTFLTYVIPDIIIIPWKTFTSKTN